MDHKERLIRNAKGSKDRITVIPETCLQFLKDRIDRFREYFNVDMKEGIDHIELPNALIRKFPNAGKQYRWRFVFSSYKAFKSPRSNWIGRHHVHPGNLAEAVAKATHGAGIDKYVTCHTLRHSFGTWHPAGPLRELSPREAGANS